MRGSILNTNKPMERKFVACVLEVISDLHPYKLAEQTLSSISNIISPRLCKGYKFDVLGIYSKPEKAVSDILFKPCDMLVIIVGSGGTEHLIIEIVESTRKPVYLIAYDGYNSLPALIESTSYLRLKGHRFLYSFIRLNKPSKYKNEILSKLRVLKGILSLYDSTIGVIGKISPWLVYSKVPASMLKETFQMKQVNVSINKLKGYIEKSEIDELLAKKLSTVLSTDVSMDSLKHALKIYRAIKRIIEDYKLSGATIDCFGVAEELGVTPCLAVALLNSEGYILGCEGDIPALLTIMANRYLVDEPSMIGNLSIIDRKELVISHCTIPLSMTIYYSLMGHFETGLGVAVSGRLPIGHNVVISKLDPRNKRILVLRGRVKDSVPRSPRLCQTQITVEFNEPIDHIIDLGLGNHLVLTLGTHSELLEDMGKFLGWKVISNNNIR